MLRSGKERLSDFGRLWLELDDYIAAKRRNVWLGAVIALGVLAMISAGVVVYTGDGEALTPVCITSGIVGIIAVIGIFALNASIDRMARKVRFAKDLTKALADDYHPARKILYYLDLRSYDTGDKRYWSGRSRHGNSKYRYLDRWFRQKFTLIDGTEIIVERKADVKVRKGAVMRHKRRVYIKIRPATQSFGHGVGREPEALDSMVRAAIRESFHDPPEFIKVRQGGESDVLEIKITQLDAPIFGSEVVSVIEAMLLYLQMTA